MKPTLIFDYDGTIHDTLHIYEPVMRDTYHWLAQEGYVEEKPLAQARIAGWLGLNAKEMWEDFQPQLAEEILENFKLLVPFYKYFAGLCASVARRQQEEEN